MKRILILRFSAMGDVLLLVPVIRSLIVAHPDVEVTVATRPRFAPFFAGLERVKVFEADVDYHFTGFFGIRKLFFALLVRADFDVVIDMHDHIRTVILRNLFRLFGKPVVVFDKGRKEKKAFVRRDNKITTPLPHTVDRYHKALEEAGFSFTLQPGPWLLPDAVKEERLNQWLLKQGTRKNGPWIGLAPFALHRTKIWPLANYPKLIELLIRRCDPRIFLFGGGEDEIRYFRELKAMFPDCVVIVAGQLKTDAEIALVHRLDVMVCTDSANMHLAALCGIPVVSIWGGTHPDVGFAPLAQENSGVLQIGRETLPCRPCSVYGKETCYRGDYACLTGITVEMVAHVVLQKLSRHLRHS